MYSQNDINEKLRSLGIKEGSHIYCSSSLGLLGKPSFDYSNIEEITKIFFEEIMLIVGNRGTIFAPTFTYSFKSGRSIEKNIFNMKKTKSKVGPFGNYILKHKNSIRNNDPMTSIVGFGSMSSILNKNNQTSYGKGCTFEKLLNVKDLKILNLGVGINFIPFLHHIDFLSNCSHRYKKFFYGYLINNNKRKKKIRWEYHVPYLRNEANSTGYKISKLKNYSKLFSKVKLGSGYLYLSDYNKTFQFVKNICMKNPWITAEGPEFQNAPKV